MSLASEIVSVVKIVYCVKSRYVRLYLIFHFVCKRSFNYYCSFYDASALHRSCIIVDLLYGLLLLSIYSVESRYVQLYLIFHFVSICVGCQSHVDLVIKQQYRSELECPDPQAYRVHLVYIMLVSQVSNRNSKLIGFSQLVYSAAVGGIFMSSAGGLPGT